MTARRFFITGGAGFIGSALVRRAIRDGHRVLNVDKLTYASTLQSVAEVEANPTYAFARVDVCDAAAVRALFADFRPDAVVHLAAESHVDRSIEQPDAFVQTNVLGTFTMLDEAARHWRSLDAAEARAFRFLHVSTDEVFGSLAPDGPPFDERSPYAPNSPYSASKAGADHLARAWHRTYGFPVVVTNCSNNYGPYQFPEKLIPVVIQSALDEREIPVYGDGGNVRDWLYVEDHVDALLRVVERGQPGETYVVGGRSERKNIDLVRDICRIVDALRPDGAPRERLTRFVTDRPGHDRRYAIDPSKTERELGWRARESLSTGLEKTVRWYLANQAWCDDIKAGRYGVERHGLGRAS